VAARTEARVVLAAGAVQGIVLVTFPAASTIFTYPGEYDLSSTQYGTLFLPQVITVRRLAARDGTGPSLRDQTRIPMGLALGLVSMLLLLFSQFFTADSSVAYGLLLVATGFLGAGFGLTVPSLNTLTAAFQPESADSSVLVLNALLGVGTVLAPVFVAVFVDSASGGDFRSRPRSCSPCSRR
jgi:MFS family permease